MYSTCLPFVPCNKRALTGKEGTLPNIAQLCTSRFLQNSVCFLAIFLLSNDLIELIEKPTRGVLFFLAGFSISLYLHLRSVCTSTSPHSLLSQAFDTQAFIFSERLRFLPGAKEQRGFSLGWPFSNAAKRRLCTFPPTHILVSGPLLSRPGTTAHAFNYNKLSLVCLLPC
jgi:hypothetical protein